MRYIFSCLASSAVGVAMENFWQMIGEQKCIRLGLGTGKGFPFLIEMIGGPGGTPFILA